MIVEQDRAFRGEGRDQRFGIDPHCGLILLRARNGMIVIIGGKNLASCQSMMNTLSTVFTKSVVWAIKGQ